MGDRLVALSRWHGVHQVAAHGRALTAVIRQVIGRSPCFTAALVGQGAGKGPILAHFRCQLGVLNSFERFLSDLLSDTHFLLFQNGLQFGGICHDHGFAESWRPGDPVRVSVA